MKARRRTIIILASSVILMLLFFVVGRVTVAGSKDLLVFSRIAPVFGDSPWLDAFQFLFQFLAAFLFLFVFPLLLIRFVLKEAPARHGWQLGDRRFGLKIFVLGVVLAVPVLFCSASTPQLQAEYPLSKTIARSLSFLILYEALYLLYYIAWEFFFRGFLQLGLAGERTTRRAVILIVLYQTFWSTLLHVGKPAAELGGAAAVGPIFGLVALRSKSAVPLIAIHYLVGVLTDIFSLHWLGLL